MLLLDRIVDHDLEDCRLAAEVDTAQDGLFYDADLGGVPAWVGFEYMAQSIAALSGVNSRLCGGEPKIGFIMSVRAFQTEVPAYRAGETLRVDVAQIFRDGNVVSFDCAVSRLGRVLTTAVVNAIEVDEAVIQGGLIDG
jgi:predicted hotdog family 3-hydroxylacyl-ACP dehydratase